MDGSLPHHPHQCTKEVLNFFVEFPYWKEYLEEIAEKLPDPALLDNVTEVIKFFKENSKEPCQRELFDLPFIYVGG